MPLAKYPHMKADEASVWDRFLSKMPWKAVNILYDVRLGEGAVIAEGVPDWVKSMAWALSTKRVDAIVETSMEFILVEVKDRGALSAVGQLLGYLVLFNKQYRPQKRVRLALVCAYIAPDMGPVLQEYGIETYLV
jgi:hypothetical protein